MQIYYFRSLLSTIHGHTHWVTSLSLHPTMPYLLSSSLDGSARLWDYSRCTNNLLGFFLIRSFLSLAHRTSSTTSPLTAVDTLFGALDVATEEVEKIKTQVAGCPLMKIHSGMGGFSRINILCSFPPLSSACLCG